jgi:hypothetical protein
MNKILVSVLVGLAAIVGATQPAGAQTAGASSKADWSGHQACAVFAADDVRCYSTEAEMRRVTSKAVAAERTGATALTASSYCNGRSDLWVYLYENTGFGGRVLQFRDPAIWQNLSTWAFDDQMSSWRNDTGCAVWAAEGNDGAGSWLTLGANSSNGNVGATWDNRVSSIYING